MFVRTSFFVAVSHPGIWGIAALALLGPASTACRRCRGFSPISCRWGSGLLLAAMLAADMSTDSSYMLTWASDLQRPLARFRRRSWGDREGCTQPPDRAAIGVFCCGMGCGTLRVTLDLPRGDPGRSTLPACRRCSWRLLLAASPTGAAAAIVAGAVIPVAYLVLEQLPATAAFARTTVGPYWSGLAAYAASALAMMVGSWLRPAKEAS